MTAADPSATCSGALRPVQSGDGIVVRIRPFNGRLRRAQADGIASLAAAHGNGMLDLTSDGCIQIRGVSDQSYAPLIQGLGHMSLLDADGDIEARRNVLVTPLWQTGGETEMLARLLTEAISQPNAPATPCTFGFAVDTGRAPVLQAASADIRLERDAGGGLILVADGSDKGKLVTAENIISEALALAQWFLDNRSDHMQMADLLRDGAALPPDHFVPRQSQTYVPEPGYTPLGAMVGLAFGQLPVETLASLAKQGGLRLTPWRMMLVESARELPDVDGLITDPTDPLLRITACTGAPVCARGLAQTRPIARALAPHLKPEQTMHVSGCELGCAHPKPSPLAIVATPEGLDLIREGRAGDPPDTSARSVQEVIEAL